MKGKYQKYDKDGSKNGPNNLEVIPFDIAVEILTRLPVKSLLKIQYVSKTWCSIIRSKNFINSLVSTPSSRFLISLTNGALTNDNDEKHLFFFTSLKEEEESSSLVANLDMKMSSKDHRFSQQFVWVNGFTCLSHKGRIMVCNPSTRQVITLPEIETADTYWTSIFRFLGYDPVDDQYKAICKIHCEETEEHMVLTLGSDKTYIWRKIEGATQSYEPITKGICINGFVYYGAWIWTPRMCRVIVRFDVRSEKLSLIKLPWYAVIAESTSSLINYKGNLGYVKIDKYNYIELWVLLEAEEHQWSLKTRQFQTFQKDSLTNGPISIHGINNIGEIIIAPKFLLPGLGPFTIIFYDVEKEKVTKVQLEGLADDEDFRRRYGIGNNGDCHVCISPEHVPDFNFL